MTRRLSTKPYFPAAISASSDANAPASKPTAAGLTTGHSPSEACCDCVCGEKMNTAAANANTPTTAFRPITNFILLSSFAACGYESDDWNISVGTLLYSFRTEVKQS